MYDTVDEAKAQRQNYISYILTTPPLDHVPLELQISLFSFRKSKLKLGTDADSFLRFLSRAWEQSLVDDAA